MSCTVSELPTGCRLRNMSSTAQNPTVSAGNSNSNGNGTGTVGIVSSGHSITSLNTGGIHIGGLLTSTSMMGAAGSATAVDTITGDLANVNTPLQRQQHQQQTPQSQKPCCFCWCCCCSCSWAKCLALKNAEENGTTKSDAGGTDLFTESDLPPLEEIRSWGQSFDKLMSSMVGRQVFRDFLRSEFSEENILFWLACEELKNESNTEVIEEKARLIYEDYISILSPREVSLDARVRDIVNRNMVEPTPHTFDDAQLQIYTLMLRDSYPRFINSQKFKTLAQLKDGLSVCVPRAESPP